MTLFSNTRNTLETPTPRKTNKRGFYYQLQEIEKIITTVPNLAIPSTEIKSVWI
jgi:hypothetical protein